MTCVIGYSDKKNDCVWMGCDSLGSNGYSQQIESSPKIFHNETIKDVIMGGTTSFRHLDLLRYSECIFNEIDAYKNIEIDHKYMVQKFIPKVFDLFKNGMFDCSDTNKGANFIVGANSSSAKLFEIQNDFSVLEPKDGFCAVGSGEYMAYGSLYTTKDYDIPVKDKILIALEAAESFSCGVKRPFRIINTKNSEEIIIG